MIKKLLPILLLLTLSLSACKPKMPASADISSAVAATLAAFPQPTPQPTFTPYPTITPHAPALEGLFCEYKFCIGHPASIALFDTRDIKNPSIYNEGMLAAYSPDFFNLVIWQPNNGLDDPQFMLEIILEEGLDTRDGNLDVNLLGDLSTFYSPITTSASEVLPVGGVAVWMCGDRAFAWKAYTPTQEIAKNLFDNAMKKFQCAK